MNCSESWGTFILKPWIKIVGFFPKTYSQIPLHLKSKFIEQPVLLFEFIFYPIIFTCIRIKTCFFQTFFCSFFQSLRRYPRILVIKWTIFNLPFTWFFKSWSNPINKLLMRNIIFQKRKVPLINIFIFLAKMFKSHCHLNFFR